jgi:hypothetical protein
MHWRRRMQLADTPRGCRRDPRVHRGLLRPPASPHDRRRQVACRLRGSCEKAGCSGSVTKPSTESDQDHPRFNLVQLSEVRTKHHPLSTENQNPAGEVIEGHKRAQERTTSKEDLRAYSCLNATWARTKSCSKKLDMLSNFLVESKSLAITVACTRSWPGIFEK